MRAIRIPDVTLLEEIGRSERSVVYRAVLGERDLAVKLLRDDKPAFSRKDVRQFYREAGMQVHMAQTAYRKALDEVRLAFAEVGRPPPRLGLAGWAAAASRAGAGPGRRRRLGEPRPAPAPRVRRGHGVPLGIGVH